MGSFRVRQGGFFAAAATATATFVACAALAVAGPAAAQQAGTGEPPLLVEQIQEILSRDGVYSAQLLAPLTSLALRHQEHGEHALALVAIERALQVLRVNRGLHTLEQVPLLRQRLASEEARGAHRAAWETEQQLLALARRHPDDPRAAAVLAEIASRQMAVLGRYLDGEKPPQLFFGCYYKQWPRSDAGSCTAGSRKIVVQGMLAEAQRNYSEAIAVLLRQGLEGGHEVRKLELELLRGVDLVRSLYYNHRSQRPLPMVPAYVGSRSIEPWRSRIAAVADIAAWGAAEVDGSALEDAAPIRAAPEHAHAKHLYMMSPYHRGRQSLRRLYAYAVADDGPALAEADALVQLADWDLLYSHNGQAVERYQAAHALLASAGAAPTLIASLFAPDPPVVLPAFQPNPFARDASRASTGHVDVTFEISRYGRGRAVEIGAAANANAAAVDELVALIKRSRFRPRFADGQVADAAPVRVRYFLYD